MTISRWYGPLLLDRYGRVVLITIMAVVSLAGPPLIGFLGGIFTVLHAITAVAVALLIATLLTRSLRPITPAGACEAGRTAQR